MINDNSHFFDRRYMFKYFVAQLSSYAPLHAIPENNNNCAIFRFSFSGMIVKRKNKVFNTLITLLKCVICFVYYFYLI